MRMEFPAETAVEWYILGLCRFRANNMVMGFQIINNELYVCGCFDTIYGVSGNI